MICVQILRLKGKDYRQTLDLLLVVAGPDSDTGPDQKLEPVSSCHSAVKHVEVMLSLSQTEQKHISESNL